MGKERGVGCRGREGCWYVGKERGVGVGKERGVGMLGWRGVYCRYVGNERV